MEEVKEIPEKPSRWRGRLGWFLFALGAAERIIGWGGSLDFLISRWSDPGWVGTVLKFIATNSAYFSFVMMLAGVAFIVWSERRRTERLVEARIGAPLPAPSASPESVSEPVAPGDTFHATGTVSDPTPEAALERLLHTCYVLASVEKLKDGNFIELIVVAYNASPKTLILADVSGNARAQVRGDGGKQTKEKLPIPDLVRLAPSRQIAPFSEFVMTFHQTVSERQALFILGTMRKESVVIDFNELRLEFTPFREPGPLARLPLWDGVSLSTASGPRSNRATILRAETARFNLNFGGTEQ